MSTPGSPEPPGEPFDSDESIRLLYAEMRKIAANQMIGERPGHTLRATDLVHEAWLRLGDRQRFENRRHFLGAAAEAMRRILVDHARRKRAARHGGDQQRVDLDTLEFDLPAKDPDELLHVHELIDELARLDVRKAEVIKLCYFGGYTAEEVGEILGLTARTVKRDCQFARAWMYDALQGKN